MTAMDVTVWLILIMSGLALVAVVVELIGVLRE